MLFLVPNQKKSAVFSQPKKIQSDVFHIDLIVKFIIINA